MRQTGQWTSPDDTTEQPSAEDRQAESDRQTASLAGLAFALAIATAGVFLVHELRAKSLVEDCLMAGQSNCNVLVAEAPADNWLPR